VAALPWNQWQLSRGMGGRLRLESVATLVWNTHQELTKKKNDGIQSSSLRAHAVITLYREMRQKLLHLLCRAGRRMLHVMKTDEAFDIQYFELDSP